MNQLHRQKFVNRRSMILAASQVAIDDGLNAVPLKVGPRKRPGIEQHLADVFGKSVPVPDPEMNEFVAPEKEALEMQRRQTMVNLASHCGMP